MTNRIVNLDIQTHSLTPNQAELWIVVTAESTTETTQIRGRFVGPKCALASTVEVAYPLRPFPRKPVGLPELAARVVIPEPSCWETECPFVYDGVIELWQDDVCCDVRQVPGYRLMACGSHNIGGTMA